ncbi:MAG: polysaccharide pyruvyl transferase family protein [Pseudomonas sp.]
MIAIFCGHLINLGDALIALREARHFQAKGHKVVVCPYEEAHGELRADFEQLGIDIVPIRNQPLKALWVCMRSHIIFGGGHMVREQVSSAWLLFTTLAFLGSRLFGHRVVIAGVGVSKVQHKLRARLYRAMLRLATVAYVRDPVSEQVLRDLAPASSGKIHLGGDMAFIGGPIENLPASGVCIIAPAVDKSENRSVDHEEILLVLNHLKHQGLRRVALVPHDIRDDFDLQACREIKAYLADKVEVPVDILPINDLSSGLLPAYREASWVITARLHGLILASLNGATVFYTEASSKKLKYFAEFFGYTSARKDNPAATSSEGLAQITSSLSERAEMSIQAL